MYGRQPIGRPGLTVKRRPHFTNIYGPFCPDCGQPLDSKRALDTHLAMAHAKRTVHYQHRKTANKLSDVNRPINVEQIIKAGCGSDDRKAWLRDMKRVPRLARTCHTDLILVEPVMRKPPSEKRIYPFCLRIVLRGLEPTLTSTPKRMRRVRDHVSQHLNLVRRIQEQRRYARLRAPEARARLLAVGLARPEVCLTYAERTKASPREFRKAVRATWYDRNE
jgi:hypothetical protein